MTLVSQRVAWNVVVSEKELEQNGSIANSLFGTFQLKWILVNLVSMMTTLSISGSWIGLTEEHPQIPESPEIINCQESQILIFNICPTKSYHLSFDQNFEWCQKKRSQKDLVGVSLFLSQSLKVILNCSTKSKEVVIHINYIYIPNVTSRELIVGLLT